MIVDLVLEDGDWEGFVTLKLTYIGSGKGNWSCSDANWINLVAYGTEGNFSKRIYASTSALCFFDGNGTEPAFVMLTAPMGEWDKSKHDGALVINSPRNSYGSQIPDTSWRTIRNPF